MKRASPLPNFLLRPWNTRYGFVWFVVCGCVCVFVIEFSFIVNNSGGWQPRVALYSLRSSASIIKEWYLLTRTGVMVAEERGGGIWTRGGKKKLNSDGCLLRLWYHFSITLLILMALIWLFSLLHHWVLYYAISKSATIFCFDDTICRNPGWVVNGYCGQKNKNRVVVPPASLSETALRSCVFPLSCNALSGAPVKWQSFALHFVTRRFSSSSSRCCRFQNTHF